jgi:hypothetical protein
MLNIEVHNIDRFNAACEMFVKDLGWEQKDVVKQQTRLLAEELMHATPPFPKGTDGTSKAGQEAGMNAVRRDLTRAVTPASAIFSSDFKDKSLEKIVQRKNYDKLNAMLPHLPGLSHWTAVPFTEDLHTSQKRYAGKAREMFRMTMDERKWKQYLAKLQGRVGYVKSGWGYIVQQLGGNVPAWISKHFGYTPGKMIQNLDDTKPSIKIDNTVPMSCVSKYNFAFKKRTREMLENLAFRINKKAKERGLSK